MASTRSSQSLVRCAVELIETDGLDALTLSRVADHAGVSRATAYREFGDKDGLITSVAQHEIQNMITAMSTSVDLHGDPMTTVHSTVLFALGYLREHRAFVYVRDHEPHWLLNAALVIGDTRMNLVQTVAALVAPVMAQPDDSRLAVSPAQAAELVVRAVLSHTLIEQSALSDEEVADAVARSITPI